VADGVSGAASAREIVVGDAVSNAVRGRLLICLGGVLGMVDATSASEVVGSGMTPNVLLSFLLVCLGGLRCVTVGVGGCTSMDGTGTS
jgi:hypothetical protein